MTEGLQLDIKTLAHLDPEQRVSSTGPTAQELFKQKTVELKDIPDNVPFTFLGTGLSFLYHKEQGGNVWGTFTWVGPIPEEYEFGAMYLKNQNSETYKKIGADNKHNWLWLRVNPEEEKMKRTQAIKPGWEEKVYFNENEYPEAVNWNEILNRQGWTLFSQGKYVNNFVDIPESLKLYKITPLVEGSTDSFILYDPERAEVAQTGSNIEDEEVERNLLEQGWQLKDINPLGKVYVRTNPQVWNRINTDQEDDRSL